MSQTYFTVPRFSGHARSLRRFYEQQFANPHHGHEHRFVWDYWYVPGQYQLHRTPAKSYFPKPLWDPFEKKLRQFARKELGCLEISQPWLSYYIDGCQQHLHADIPHGPWSFVFSLTPWSRRQF